MLSTILDGWRFVGRHARRARAGLGMLGAFGAAGFVVGLSQTFVQDLGAGQAGFGVLFGAVFVGLAAGHVARARACSRASRGGGSSGSR